MRRQSVTVASNTKAPRRRTQINSGTACAFSDLSKDRPSLVLATASPAKFPDTIVSAIGVEPTDPSLEVLKQRPLKKHLLKADAAVIRAFIDAHAV